MQVSDPSKLNIREMYHSIHHLSLQEGTGVETAKQPECVPFRPYWYVKRRGWTTVLEVERPRSGAFGNRRRSAISFPENRKRTSDSQLIQSLRMLSLLFDHH